MRPGRRYDAVRTRPAGASTHLAAGCGPYCQHRPSDPRPRSDPPSHLSRGAPSRPAQLTHPLSDPPLTTAPLSPSPPISLTTRGRHLHRRKGRLGLDWHRQHHRAVPDAPRGAHLAHLARLPRGPGLDAPPCAQARLARGRRVGADQRRGDEAREKGPGRVLEKGEKGRGGEGARRAGGEGAQGARGQAEGGGRTDRARRG